MNTFWKLFGIAFAAVLVIDGIWLTVARKFYVQQLAEIGRISSGKINAVYWSVGVVYLLLAFAISFFVMPLLAPGAGWGTTLLYGAALGLVVYGVYDFTNHATLHDFSLKLVLVDVAWGCTLCALATATVKYFRDGS